MVRREMAEPGLRDQVGCEPEQVRSIWRVGANPDWEKQRGIVPPPLGLGPWVGAQVVSPRSSTLRPGRHPSEGRRMRRAATRRGSVSTLPASRRAAKPAGVLKRLQRIAQALVLDRQQAAQLRSRHRHALDQKGQHSLLETASLTTIRPPVLRKNLQTPSFQPTTQAKTQIAQA
jgi:hypothetical protein